MMHEARPVRRQFELVAGSEPQLELRLQWFGSALAVRRGHIVAVDRKRGGSGQHVASIAYEVPLPDYLGRPIRGRRGPARRRFASAVDDLPSQR